MSGTSALWTSATTLDDLLTQLTARFTAAGIEQASVDALLLVEHVTGHDRSDILRHRVLRTPVGDLIGRDSSTALTALTQLAQRRERREPLQHLTGIAYFRRLSLEVGAGVFIPRPETELLAEHAITEAHRIAANGTQPVVVDLCTGSGVIALAIATEVPSAQVYAVELDQGAYTWATRNNHRYADPVHLTQGDARTALSHMAARVDIVVSNPPYIPSDAIPRDHEVAHHDPAVALYGLGDDGLEVPRGVTMNAALLLRPQGLYLMEHADSQADAARAMVDGTTLGGDAAFTLAKTHADLTGRPRMVSARRQPHPDVEG